MSTTADNPAAISSHSTQPVQRSLVGINRLLLSCPRVWLLDEPTASLDQNTESAACLGSLIPAGGKTDAQSLSLSVSR